MWENSFLLWAPGHTINFLESNLTNTWGHLFLEANAYHEILTAHHNRILVAMINIPGLTRNWKHTGSKICNDFGRAHANHAKNEYYRDNCACVRVKVFLSLVGQADFTRE